MIRVKKRIRSGFTLIELLVAVGIIVLLSAIGIVNYASAAKKARDGRRQADMGQLRAGLEMFRSDRSTYPLAGAQSDQVSWSTFMTDLSGYLTEAITDPRNTSPYYYTYTPVGNGYTVCANELEGDGSTYCLNSP